MSNEYEHRIAKATSRVTAFREAVNQHSDDDIAAACVPEVWNDRYGALRGLVAQVKRKGLVLDPIGEEPTLFGPRGCAWTAISHPSRPKPLGDLFILIEHHEGQWMVSGVTKHRGHVGLFLERSLDGSVDVEDLPSSPAADAWAVPIAAALAQQNPSSVPEGSIIDLDAPIDDTSVEQLPSHALEVAGRAAVGFRFMLDGDDFETESWTVLDLSSSPPQIVGTGESLTLESLLVGLTIPWPKEAPDAPGVALTPEERPTNPDAARRVMEHLSRGAIDRTQTNQPPTEDDLARIGAFLSAVRSTAPRPDETHEDRSRPDFAAEPLDLDLPPGVREAVEASVQRMLDDGAIETGEVRIDSAFVEEHGRDLLSAIAQAISGRVAPSGISVTVPVEGHPGDVVQLRLDPADLLRGPEPSEG